MKRSVYANPHDYVLCPILALALLVFCTDHFETDVDSTSPLVMGRRSGELRFSEWLTATLRGNDADIENACGLMAREFGTHSLRKGVATYLTGILGGPTTLALFQRAGWSTGVQQRYLFEGGQDQQAGRCASMLPNNTEKFAALPPHFPLDEPLFPAGVTWGSFVRHYEQLPASFRSTLPFLLASLCHHAPALHANLPADHPLFTAPVFTSGLVKTLAPRVLLGNYQCPVTGLAATGVPPMVEILRNIQQSHESLLASQNRHAEDMVRMLEATTAETARTQQLITNVTTLVRDVGAQVADLPRAVIHELAEENALNTTRPLTREEMANVMRSSLNTALGGVQAQLSELAAALAAPRNGPVVAVGTAAAAPAPPALAPTAAAAPVNNEWYLTFQHSGRLAVSVPEHFKLQSGLEMGRAWMLWHLGDRTQRIRPYRMFNPRVDMQGPNKALYSKLSFVMSLLPELPADAVVAGTEFLDPAVNTLVEDRVAELLAEVYPNGAPRRGKCNSYVTFYDRIKAARANAGANAGPDVGVGATAAATPTARTARTAGAARAAGARAARAAEAVAGFRASRAETHAAARTLVAVAAGGHGGGDSDSE